MRQYSLGPYILDFYCPAAKVAIELDGGGHNTMDSKLYDKERDAYLAECGVTVLRFANTMISADVDEVLARISKALSRL